MNKVLSTIEKYALIENGDSIIVALSGGADSVTLLDILNSLKEKFNLTLYAAHLNHNLRGEEAERDENFCKILCKKYNIELFVKSLDIAALSKAQKIGEELCGRNERYKFFAELSARLGAKVATAHTASDNAETLIYNITRGTSFKGLGAITPKRDNIIRPLIECTRQQIEAYCKAQKLEYVTDSSNLSDDYTRNLIRHRVIPCLNSINPQFESSALRLSESSRELAQYINRQSVELLNRSKLEFGYSCGVMSDCDIIVLKNALALLCADIDGYTPESRHIYLMLNIIKNGGAVNLTGKVRAVSKQGIFRITPTENDCVNNNGGKNFEIELSGSMRFSYNGKTYFVSKNNSDKENKNSVSSDLLNKNAVFRTRREGDRFTYLRRNITKPLRKVLNEAKIPSELRDKLLVLAVDNDILWCENIGASMKGKNNSATELKIDILK